MRIRLITALCCTLPGAFCLLSQDAPLVSDATPVFRTTTELVLIDAQVVHKKTKTTTGALTKKDFQIYEDGVLQEIKSFSRDQLPLSIILLFDLTDSVRPVLKQLGAGAKTALTHLKPEDEVAVMVYAASARLVEGFTTDRSRTVAAIERAAGDESNEAAFFNEGVYQASQQLRQSANPSSRRVVIWLTDNLPNVPSEFMRAHGGKSVPAGSLHTEQEAFQSLYESGTVVSPLLKRTTYALPMYGMIMAFEAPWRKKYPPGDAYKYAERTGGQAVKLGGKKAEERLAELIDDLRARYTIGYRPSTAKPAGTFCKVRVDLSPETSLRPREWNVLATAGYYRP
jgi:VWFA-related protein